MTILTVTIPLFALRVALHAARRPFDHPIALGPQPGAPTIVGLCTPAATAQGVVPGLRVGEALARCPELELLVPDPGGSAHVQEQITSRLEGIGAAVEETGPGVWRFVVDGLRRLHGGVDGVLRRVKSVLPVGLDPRIGIGPTAFSSLQAAQEAHSRTPLHLHPNEVPSFLATLPVGRLPLDERQIRALEQMGVTTVGQVAAFSRSHVVDRFGLSGLRAWQAARGEDTDRVQPRDPPLPVEAAFHFPDAVGALAALHAAARHLLTELAGAVGRRGSAIRSLTIRAWMEGGGSWTRTITLREATVQVDRLTVTVFPTLTDITGPVETLVIRADASGHTAGHQISLATPGATERLRRTGEAIHQIRSAHGDDAVLQAVEMEPWSSLPERRWALVPYDASIPRDR